MMVPVSFCRSFSGSRTAQIGRYACMHPLPDGQGAHTHRSILTVWGPGRTGRISPVPSPPRLRCRDLCRPRPRFKKCVWIRPGGCLDYYVLTPGFVRACVREDSHTFVR
jgi:hypothetical protein